MLRGAPNGALEGTDGAHGGDVKTICKKIDWPFSPFGHRHMIMDGPFWE